MLARLPGKAAAFGLSATIFFTRCHCSSSLSDSCTLAALPVPLRAGLLLSDILLPCADAGMGAVFAAAGAAAESLLTAAAGTFPAFSRCHCSSSLSESALGAAGARSGLNASWPRKLCLVPVSCGLGLGLLEIALGGCCSRVLLGRCSATPCQQPKHRSAPILYYFEEL